MSKPVDKIEFWKQRIDTAVSEHYAVYVANEPLWNRINQVHEKIIKQLINDTDKVLDAGCAYGRSSIFFNKEQYTGIDFSPDFIEIAKKKYPDKDFRVMNLKNIYLPDQKFDWAFCISMKKMIVDNCGEEEWAKMEKELKRVAKKVLILEYGDELPNGGINGADKYEIL